MTNSGQVRSRGGESHRSSGSARQLGKHSEHGPQATRPIAREAHPRARPTIAGTIAVTRFGASQRRFHHC